MFLFFKSSIFCSNVGSFNNPAVLPSNALAVLSTFFNASVGSVLGASATATLAIGASTLGISTLGASATGVVSLSVGIFSCGIVPWSLPCLITSCPRDTALSASFCMLSLVGLSITAVTCPAGVSGIITSCVGVWSTPLGATASLPPAPIGWASIGFCPSPTSPDTLCLFWLSYSCNLNSCSSKSSNCACASSFLIRFPFSSFGKPPNILALWVFISLSFTCMLVAISSGVLSSTNGSSPCGVTVFSSVATLPSKFLSDSPALAFLSSRVSSTAIPVPPTGGVVGGAPFSVGGGASPSIGGKTGSSLMFNFFFSLPCATPEIVPIIKPTIPPTSAELPTSLFHSFVFLSSSTSWLFERLLITCCNASVEPSSNACAIAFIARFVKSLPIFFV